MVVRLIFKVDEPLLCHSVDLHRYNDGTCINLVGLFLILKLSFFFQLAHRHQSKIHQADKLILAAFENLAVICQILAVRILDRLFIIAIVKYDLLQLRRKRCMTAVIRPVGIQHADLCHRRISFFFVFKVILNMQEIFECHRKVQRGIEFFQRRFVHVDKTIKRDHICRLLKPGHKCLRLFKSGLSGIYRVDTVVFDCLKLFL